MKSQKRTIIFVPTFSNLHKTLFMHCILIAQCQKSWFLTPCFDLSCHISFSPFQLSSWSCYFCSYILKLTQNPLNTLFFDSAVSKTLISHSLSQLVLSDLIFAFSTELLVLLFLFLHSQTYTKPFLCIGFLFLMF